MEQAVRGRLRKELSAEEKSLFDDLLMDAVDKPWWRHFIAVLEQRHSINLNTLVVKQLSQREEDVLRGNIQAVNFILNLDERGKELLHQKERGRRDGE